MSAWDLPDHGWRPTTGYHVTAARHRASIAERGLLRDADGFDAGYVWFFSGLIIAEEAAAGRTWGGGDSGNDIWKISLEGLQVVPDPHEGWGNLRPGWDDAAFACPTNIPADRLRLLEPARSYQ